MITVYNAHTGKNEQVEKITKSDKEWQESLSKEAYAVTRRAGTEPPNTGKYLGWKEKGVFQCVGCGTDLFDSSTKYDSGTGWPSFWEPVAQANVGYAEDNSFFQRRTEVHCMRCGAHLGHVFDDGPAPTGKRFCINSVSLTFSPSK